MLSTKVSVEGNVICFFPMAKRTCCHIYTHTHTSTLNHVPKCMEMVWMACLRQLNSVKISFGTMYWNWKWIEWLIWRVTAWRVQFFFYSMRVLFWVCRNKILSQFCVSTWACHLVTYLTNWAPEIGGEIEKEREEPKNAHK